MAFGDGSGLNQQDFYGNPDGAQVNLPQDQFNPWSAFNTPGMGSGDQTTPNTKAANNSGGPNSFGYSNLPGTAISLYETIKGAQNLNALNKIPYPEYGVGNELQGAYNQAQAMSKMGFTPQEKAAFQANQNKGSATNAYYATKMGGGLGSAIQGGLNAQSLNSYNQFAGQDAALHRENIQYAGNLANQIQNQENIKTQADIQRRNQQEQAWGGVMNSGLTGLANSNVGGLSWGSLLNTGMKLAPLIAAA